MPVAQWMHVSKRYPDAKNLAVDDVSFSVDAGEIVVIVGPNGSGKTTCMEMVSGLRTPTSGKVMLQSEVVGTKSRGRQAIGVQLQEAGLPTRIRVREAIQAVACLYRDPGPVRDIVQRIGLDDQLSAMVDTLSGGWQRRLDIALACIGKPALLILDEPTSGLDPVARAEIWEFLRELRSDGTAILASTHDLTEAEAFADQLIVLDRGKKVLEGSVDDILQQAGGEYRLKVLGAGRGITALGASRELPSSTPARI